MPAATASSKSWHDVRDAVGPRHDLALGRARRGTGPRVVADAVERLRAEVERREHDVGAPDRVVVPAGDVRRERVLARVAERTVPAVVTERDRLGERDVEPQRPRDPGGDLGDLERVGEPGALVVLREDEHLRLAGEPPERRVPCRMRSRSRSKQVRHSSGSSAAARWPRAARPGGARREQLVLGAPRARPGRSRRPGRAWRRRPRGRAGPGPSPWPAIVPAHRRSRSLRRLVHAVDPTDRVRHRRRPHWCAQLPARCQLRAAKWRQGAVAARVRRTSGRRVRPMKWSSPGHVTSRASGRRAASIVAHARRHQPVAVALPERDRSRRRPRARSPTARRTRGSRRPGRAGRASPRPSCGPSSRRSRAPRRARRRGSPFDAPLRRCAPDDAPPTGRARRTRHGRPTARGSRATRTAGRASRAPCGAPGRRAGRTRRSPRCGSRVPPSRAATPSAYCPPADHPITAHRSMPSASSSSSASAAQSAGRRAGVPVGAADAGPVGRHDPQRRARPRAPPPARRRAGTADRRGSSGPGTRPGPRTPRTRPRARPRSRTDRDAHAEVPGPVASRAAWAAARRASGTRYGEHDT